MAAILESFVQSARRVTISVQFLYTAGPRPIMMSLLVVNQAQLPASIRCLWSMLTARAITNSFAGNGTVSRHYPVQNEEIQVSLLHGVLLPQRCML